MFNKVVGFIRRKKRAKEVATIRLPDDDHTPAQSRVSTLVRPEGGWQALGYDDEYRYVIYCWKTGKRRHLRHNDLTPKALRAAVGAAYCEKQYRKLDPKTQEWGVDYQALAEQIVHECDAKGLVSPEGVRSTGFYRDGDELIVHYGHEVRTAEGVEVDVTPTPERIYVAGKRLDVSPDTSWATDEDIRVMTEVLKSFTFSKVEELVLILGWAASRAYGHAVQVHPLVVLDAEPEAGKTTLVGFLCGLLGAQVLRREGIPKRAQVVYGLEDLELTLFFDELEATSSDRRDFGPLEELTRVGFTTCEQPRIARVIGGRVRVFNTPAGVLYSGVGTPELKPATETRAIRIRMVKPADGERASLHELLNPGKRKELLALGRRFRALMLSRWQVMRQAQSVFRDRLLALKHGERTAEKYAVVLAGYVTLTVGSVPSTEEVDAVINETGLGRKEQHVVEPDYDICLRTLLSECIAIRGDGPGARRTETTIGDVVCRIITGPEAERPALSAYVEPYGLRVDHMGGWKLTIASSGQHPRLSGLFRHTNYGCGAWKQALLRRPGAEETVQRFGRKRPTQRAVRFDVPEFVLSADEDDVYPAL